jgi:hypothetical protein
MHGMEMLADSFAIVLTGGGARAAYQVGVLRCLARCLPRYGIIKRVHYKEIPPRVEYSVTALGRSLHPFFRSLCDWGGQHFPAFERARLRYDKRAKPS